MRESQENYFHDTAVLRPPKAKTTLKAPRIYNNTI
jgi:hypothetical protein